ncbi:hypothetical protein SCLCIDRAFT_1213244 [Scleroderma citrinum Foug A]|uniref:Uncharacterized protein n=1 Tax=Scleroderma citrinum Foug A TaxID=1036808 RepID=A0A0C3AHK1_9AGAM|nr:hypothetical protein SCLCIDRAFT_1213244 [Scleroderma citrinum Foug A]
MAETLHMSGIDIRNAQKIESAQLIIRGQPPYNIPPCGESAFRELFNPALQLSSRELCSLIMTQRGFLGLRKTEETILIESHQVLSKLRDFKYHLPHRRFSIVLDFVPSGVATGVTRRGGPSTIPTTQSGSNELLTPTSDGQLIPTTEELLRQCPQFRILVMGKSGVGKTTLINRTFGINEASPEHEKRGIADINKELTSEMNARFILHDSKGFEPGENDNLATVKQFIDRRKNHPEIKEQLHAVWLCFQIPLVSHGQRMMETGMEQFLREKRKILGNVPTVFVFTKYDTLTEIIESNWVDQQRDYSDKDVEVEAKKYLLSHCVTPIQNLTSERDFPYIAVSTKIRYKTKLTDLVDMTHDKVTEHSETQQGTGPSPVPTVTAMAQRVSPQMKIDELIRVGKRRYWRAVIAGADFPGLKIQDCLGVIHTDIVNVWNFRNPSEQLDRDFREGMLGLVGLLDDPSGAQPHPPRRSDTMDAMENEAGLSLVVLFPLIAGVAVVKWAYNTYCRVPEVQRKFMAYIVDLTHVLDILFTLTAGKGEQALTPRIMQCAIELYRESSRSTYVHEKIKNFPVSIFSNSGIISEVECLVRERYIQDDRLRHEVERVSKDRGGR